jgi:hypothetical protein
MHAENASDGAFGNLFVKQSLDFGFFAGQFFDFGFAAFRATEYHTFGFFTRQGFFGAL